MNPCWGNSASVIFNRTHAGNTPAHTSVRLEPAIIKLLHNARRRCMLETLHVSDRGRILESLVSFDAHVIVSWSQLFLSSPVCCLSAEGSAVKGPAPKKQKQEKQRSRKEKAAQHTFSHPLLAASLKVNWNTQWLSKTHYKSLVVQEHVRSYEFYLECICDPFLNVYTFARSRRCLTLGSFCVHAPVRATAGTWRALISAVTGSTWRPALTTAPSGSGAPKTSWSGNTSVWGPTWSWITPR